MKPSIGRLFQLVPRKDIPKHCILPALRPYEPKKDQITVHDILLERKEKAGTAWPSNIRVEPPLTKKVLEPVDKRVRGLLKRLISKET